MALTIGKVAKAAGVKIDTLRYYERRGILPEPERTASGYRVYTEDAVDRVRFVKRAQELGLTLSEIAELLDLRVDHVSACASVEVRARVKLADVDEKLRELQRMREVLSGLVHACQERRPTDECPILAVLDDGEPGERE